MPVNILTHDITDVILEHEYMKSINQKGVYILPEHDWLLSSKLRLV